MNTYGWQRFYEAATFETNHTRLPSLIESAQAAIDARMWQIHTNNQNSENERRAIEDALSALRILRQEIARIQNDAASRRTG
jgi:hypothetical protein